MKLTPLTPRITPLSCSSVRLKSWGSTGGSYKAPYWRFYWNREKGARVSFAGQVTELTPSKYLLIPANTDFRAQLLSPVTHFFAHFRAAPPYDQVEPGIYTYRARPDIRRLIAQVNACTGQQSERADHRASMALLALLHTALAALPEDLLSFREPDDRIDKVLSHMATSLDSLCPNDELAAVAGMNTNAFIRRFHEVVGDSPQRYHLKQRIERACLLLHFSPASIDQIAERTGFCDRFHFSRVFKRISGSSPAAFRRKAVSETVA